MRFCKSGSSEFNLVRKSGDDLQSTSSHSSRTAVSFTAHGVALKIREYGMALITFHKVFYETYFTAVLGTLPDYLSCSRIIKLGERCSNRKCLHFVSEIHFRRKSDWGKYLQRAVLTLELCANAIIHRFEDFQQHRVRSDGICQTREEKNNFY